jgi:hypothetical protein
VLRDLFYHLGTVVGGLGSHLPGKGGAGGPNDTTDAAIYDPETGESYDLEPDPSLGYGGGVVAGAAAAWLLGRALRPRPLSWPRVVVAGVAATFLADLVERTLDPEGVRGAAADAEEPDEIIRRYGTGVAMAAGYATLLYPRLPGPPLLRGLTFAALDLAAAPRGGLVGLAGQVPALRYPLQTLARPADGSQRPLSYLAFGVGLGLFYRYGRDE